MSIGGMWTQAVQKLLKAADQRMIDLLAPLMVLGLNHEQQHQELMLTDIKHVFWMNPLRPAFQPEKMPAENEASVRKRRRNPPVLHAGAITSRHCIPSAMTGRFLFR